ncbi:MAG: ATP-binding protein [Candidatus Ozemobacteraceae bacterium]
MERDISLEKVQNFIEMANKVRGVQITDDPLTVLQKYELIRDGRITRAAFFLFMSVESSLSTIELGRFQTETIIKDGSRLKTDLFSEVSNVMEFIRKHINRSYVISGKPQREERWEYPIDAIREVVLNSIVHRDYSSSSDSIVKIFDDRIEVYNPGKLSAGLTVEKLLKGDYRSSIRNRKIADIFKEAGLVEKYGSGIRRIVEGFKEYGLPEPKFQEISDGFMVTMYCDKVVTQKTTQKTTQKLLDMLIENPFLSRSTLAELLVMTEEGVKYQLTKLKKMGRIRRVGADKGGFWEVIQ